MTIGALLSQQVRARPNALALVDDREGRQVTFAELETEAAHAAAWWQSQGLSRGMAALVFVPMSIDLYVALLALFRLGAVALFLDPSAGREHIDQCCARWTPDALLAIPVAHLLRLRTRALRRIPVKASIGNWVPGAKRWPTPWRNGEVTEDFAKSEDAALVTFTSGSTGVPKAVVRTHRFLLAQHRVLESNIALEADEVDLATLPVFVLANLAAGVTTVIPDVDLRRPGAVDATRVFDQISRRGVTRLTAPPAFLERLIEHGQENGHTLSNVRKLYTGGAPVFPRLLEALGKVAPEAKIVAVYGSTEAEPIAHIESEAILQSDLDAMRSGRGLLAGHPVKEVTLRILRDRWGEPLKEMTAEEFAKVTLQAGQAGEIVVSGEHVLKGYLGGIGDEETKFRVEGETWHRTGDAGLLDESGRLWLLGRCAARVDDSRGSLYPLGVECTAITFPEVRRAAFIARGGKRLLVIEGELDDALRQRIRAQTAQSFLDDVILVKRIPVDKRHNSKIDYPALRRLLKIR